MTTPDNDDLSYLSNMSDEPEPEDTTDTVDAGAESDEGNEPEADAETDVAPEGDAEEQEEEEEGKPAGKTEGDPETQTRHSRKENRVQKLANERNQEREARIRAEAERDALLKFRSAAPTYDNGEASRARREKLDLMEPTERALFLQNEEMQSMKQQLFLGELRAEDRADKAAFDSRAVVDPRYARHKDEVEKRLGELRTKGINATREQMLVQILGERLLTEKPRTAARKAAAARVDSTKAKPTNARSTQSAPAAGKGDGLADIEARLKGKSFNSMFGN